jgi:hypothetical protein
MTWFHFVLFIIGFVIGFLIAPLFITIIANYEGRK